VSAVKPLMIDLFAGLGGWADGGLAEGYDVVGFDIERHAYGDHKYPAQLVLQDVLTLYGSQFKDVDLIVASPPCQEFSYMAMPWKRAKQIARALRGQDEFPQDYAGSRTVAELTALFDACFRIQREASEAAGKHIPMVVENVRGAQEWVGRSRWAYGSFHLFGDVPALMPMRLDGGIKVTGLNWSKHGTPGYAEGPGRCFTDSAFAKIGGKAASAMIAKIPLTLARHIARVYHP
jgi:C-5 cytosine-specific DNA methylase